MVFVWDCVGLCPVRIKVIPNKDRGYYRQHICKPDGIFILKEGKREIHIRNLPRYFK